MHLCLLILMNMLISFVFWNWFSQVEINEAWKVKAAPEPTVIPKGKSLAKSVTTFLLSTVMHDHLIINLLGKWMRVHLRIWIAWIMVLVASGSKIRWVLGVDSDFGSEFVWGRYLFLLIFSMFFIRSLSKM